MNPVFEKVSFELSKQELETLQHLIHQEIYEVYGTKGLCVKYQTPNQYECIGEIIIDTSTGKILVEYCSAQLDTVIEGTAGNIYSIALKNYDDYNNYPFKAVELLNVGGFIVEKIEIFSQNIFIDEPRFPIGALQYNCHPIRADFYSVHLQIYAIAEKLIVFHSKDGRSFLVAPTENLNNIETLIINGSEAVKEELLKLKNSGAITQRYLLY